MISPQVLSRTSICILILPVSTLFGCGPGEPASPIEINDSLALETHWPYTTEFSGVLRDKKSGHEFIYSGDPVTHMTMRVFDGTGRIVRDIPLQSALDSLEAVGGMLFLSSDSLLILEELGAKYLILDTTGKVIYQRSIAEDMCDSANDYYELYAARSGAVVFNGRIYLETDWAGFCDDRVSDWQPASELEYHERYFSNSTTKCKLAELTPCAPGRSLRYGACGMLAHLADSVRTTVGSAHCMVANSQLFAFSPYSEYVYMVDPHSLNVKKAIAIRTKHGAARVKAPSVSLKDIHADGANGRIATESQIMTFCYDHGSRQYVTSFYHPVAASTPDSNRSYKRDWSLLLLNDSFQTRQEFVLSGKQYSGSVWLCTERGIWVLRLDQGRQDPKAPKVFHRLRAR